MIPDRHFVKELALFDKDLIAVFHPKRCRWQIRFWVLPRCRGDERHYNIWRLRSVPIRTVCYLDGEGYDVGYHPLDARVLYALKLSRHYSLSPGGTARMVDESNKKLEDAWAADNADISREVASSIWNHYKEFRVDLGGHAGR